MEVICSFILGFYGLVGRVGILCFVLYDFDSVGLLFILFVCFEVFFKSWFIFFLCFLVLFDEGFCIVCFLVFFLCWFCWVLILFSKEEKVLVI